MIAERLWYPSDGKVAPTTKPDPIIVGRALKEMVAQDVKDEKKAIEMYREIIKMAQEEADETTAFLFNKILQDEEDHHDTFITLLERV